VQAQGGYEVGASLEVDDEVEFRVVTNRRTGAVRAEDVQLLCKAEQRRELGQVTWRTDLGLEGWRLWT
jgi:hypothetical protein